MSLSNKVLAFLILFLLLPFGTYAIKYDNRDEEAMAGGDEMSFYGLRSRSLGVVFGDYVLNTEFNIFFISPMGVLQVAVYDSYGAEIYRESVDSALTVKLNISTQGFSAGSYFISITDQSSQVVYDSSFVVD